MYISISIQLSILYMFDLSSDQWSWLVWLEIPDFDSESYYYIDIPSHDTYKDFVLFFVL